MTLSLDLKRTALVVVDVQDGIILRDGVTPNSGEQVIARNNELAAALKNTDAHIVLVRVNNSGSEGFNPVTDAPFVPAQAMPAEGAHLTLDIAEDADAKNVTVVDKHNWGAFYGTDLDVQLRRRGIDTVILTGIATSIGVDTTAREGAQLGYNLVLVPEAMTDLTQQGHDASVDVIFPRLGKVRTVAETLAAIEAAK
jgi:Amidases related to nicotinamidase